MFQMIAAFFSLYLTTLVLLVGTGLFNTYVGLRLTADSISELWVGGIMAVYYLGLVCGARVGHKLIIRVGHIRAYGASAAIVTVTVLGQVLVDTLWVWLVFRFIAGVAMVTQFMVLESWLNEQTENHQRGRVFAFYMVVSGLGTVLGQLSLTLFPSLDYGPLVFVAICAALSLVPVTLTRRLHPALQVPAPIQVKYYLARVPLSLTVLLIAGMITGAFYGLAPVYASKMGLSADQVAVFVATAVASGLLAQWPIGWLADRINRSNMIRLNAVALAVLAVALWGWWVPPYWLLLVFASLSGILQFTLYPLGAAFANDNVDPERRVGLSAILLMVYGMGACIGPLAVGALMRELSAGMFYVFVTAVSVVLVATVRPQRITGAHLSQDAPTHFVPMPDSLQSSPVVAALDPRVDLDIDVSHVDLPAENGDPPIAGDSPGAADPADPGIAPDPLAAHDSSDVSGPLAVSGSSGAQPPRSA